MNPFVYIVSIVLAALGVLTLTTMDLGAVPSQQLDGRLITFAHTDDNSGEDVIIRTERYEYKGLGNADVYWSIENTSGTSQTFDVIFSTTKTGLVIDQSRLFMRNKNEQVTIDDYDWVTEPTPTSTREVWKKIGSHTELQEVTQWSSVPFKTKPTSDVVNSYLDKGTKVRKPTGKYFANNALSFQIKASETIYLKTNVKWTLGQDDIELYAEAIGYDGAYGNLDPGAVFVDNFDSYSTGNLVGNGGWYRWVMGAVGDIQIINTRSQTASNSITDTTAGSDSVRNAFATTTEDFNDSLICSYYVNNQKGSGNSEADIQFFDGDVDSGTDSGSVIDLRADMSASAAYFRQGGSGTSFSTNTGCCAADTWFQIETQWDLTNDQYQARFNGEDWSAWRAFEGSADANGMSLMQIGLNNGSGNDEWFVDSVDCSSPAGPSAAAPAGAAIIFIDSD